MGGGKKEWLIELELGVRGKGRVGQVIRAEKLSRAVGVSDQLRGTSAIKIVTMLHDFKDRQVGFAQLAAQEDWSKEMTERAIRHGQSGVFGFGEVLAGLWRPERIRAS